MAKCSRNKVTQRFSSNLSAPRNLIECLRSGRPKRSVSWLLNLLYQLL